jgi:hypothetical protein
VILWYLWPKAGAAEILNRRCGGSLVGARIDPVPFRARGLQIESLILRNPKVNGMIHGQSIAFAAQRRGLEAVVVSVVSHAASAAFAAIVALAHQTSSSRAVFVEGSNPASISWNGLFPNIGCTVLRSLPPI